MAGTLNYTYPIYTLNFDGPFHELKLLSVASSFPSFACRSFVLYSRQYSLSFTNFSPSQYLRLTFPSSHRDGRPLFSTETELLIPLTVTYHNHLHPGSSSLRLEKKLEGT